MGQYIEFMQHHVLLFAALAVVVVLLIGNEVFHALRGGSSVGPMQAVRMINDSDAVILDVRGEKEYRKSHIVNAKHFPRQNLEPEPKALSKLKGSDLIICATTDSIAAQVRDQLGSNGHAGVHSLKGGLPAWQNANLPVTSK